MRLLMVLFGHRSTERGRSHLPASAARLGGPLFAGARRQRRAEDDGDHRRGAGGHRQLVVPAGAKPDIPFWVVLPATPRWVSAPFGRMAHRPDDGHEDHQARAGRRVLRRNQRRRRRSSSPPRLGIPVSTTHTITGAIVGTGSVRSFSAVRWGVAGRIVWAWVLTVPGAAAMSALAYLLATSLGLER